MRDTARAMKSFVGSFGLPAYMADSIPDDVELPYLTYPVVQPEWSQKATFYIQGWYRTTENAEMLAMADQITREIGTGIIVNMDHGYFVVYPETPLIQTLVDGDTRSFYINLSVNSFIEPGE